MAIRVVCGLNGSGKSMYAVGEVIRPALDSGRVVYSNIAGLKLEHESFDVLADKERFYVTRDGHYLPRVDWLRSLPGGAVIVWDEAHLGLGAGAGKHLTAELRDWFARHRHQVDAAGRALDLWLICQHSTQLTSQLKVLVLETHHMVRVSWLGLGKATMRHLYDGLHDTTKPNVRARIASKLVRDDKSVYALYETTVGGTEQEADRSPARGKIFVILATAAVLAALIYTLVNPPGTSVVDEVSESVLDEGVHEVDEGLAVEVAVSPGGGAQDGVSRARGAFVPHGGAGGGRQYYSDPRARIVINKGSELR